MSRAEGIRWRLTGPLTTRSRKRRFEMFMAEMRPRPTDRVLDVGVTNTTWRDSNFLEARYPWPGQITAVAIEPVPAFEREHPAVRLVIADGRRLPFADFEFEIGFSNAVVEHVGSRADQRRFVAELVRTCRRVFICTPNAHFPVDPHTLLPYVHWLPTPQRYRVLEMTGNGRWASEEALNPLNTSQLVGLFPARAQVRLISQRMFLVPSVLIAVSGERATPTDTPRPSEPLPTPS